MCDVKRIRRLKVGDAVFSLVKVNSDEWHIIDIKFENAGNVIKHLKRLTNLAVRLKSSLHAKAVGDIQLMFFIAGFTPTGKSHGVVFNSKNQ